VRVLAAQLFREEGELVTLLYKCLDYEKKSRDCLFRCVESISETCIMDQALGLAG
jgi:hypothetical protein